jgi:AcrR family transcriptional regulator
MDDAQHADESLAALAVRRRIGGRQAAAEDEVRRLLDVGLELTRNDPTGNPKIADIVRMAGVSNDAFYRAFRSKDDLMAAIVDDGSRRLLSYVQHMMDKAADPQSRIRNCVTAMLTQAGDPEIASASRAVLRHAAHRSHPGTSVLELRRGLTAMLTGPLSELGSPAPAQDAFLAAGAIFAAMENYLFAEEVPTEADTEHLISWLLRAARPQ